MAFGKRVSGVLPLAGASVAAMALAGIAVFTVSQAGCGDAGHYVQRDGSIELVGSCLDPADLPAAPVEQQTENRRPAEPASNQLSELDRVRP